jgi:C-terminal processing protease CtpA/Prc
LPEYEEVFGARLVAIDGTPVDEVAEAVNAVVSHDNQWQLRSKTAYVMMTPEVLYGLGLGDQTKSVTLTIATQDGEQSELTIEAVSRAALQDAVSVQELAGGDNVPLARRHKDEWYWYEYLEDERAVYFQYDVCGNMDGQRFRAFNKEMFQFIDSHGVQRIIVDLRYNGGGNSRVLNPFLKAIDDRPALEVITLIGRQTFSSALMNAIQLDEKGATLIGEPTGGRPNDYGEVHLFRLPNSGLPIYYATRYFRELEHSDPPALEPDIPVTLTIQDQIAGFDAALEEALNLEHKS